MTDAVAAAIETAQRSGKVNMDINLFLGTYSDAWFGRCHSLNEK